MSLKLNELTVTNAINGSITGNAATVTNGLYTNSTLTAGNLSGTIPSSVLGNSSHFIGTTSIALNRASGSQTLTGISIDGNATSETFGTVTGRGSSTTTQISVGTTSAGSMYTGIKSGAGYSDTVSGATFKSITDHPTGGSFAFAAYYNGAPGTGTNSFYVAANGGAYFAQGVGVGVTSPLQALHINGNIILDGTTNGYTQGATRGIGYGSNNGGVSVDGFSGMDIQSVNAPAPNNGNYSQNLRFWTHHYGTGTGGSPRMFLQYNGNLGIGTLSPTAKLNVLSSTSLSSVLKTEGVNGTLFEVTDDLSNSLMSVNTIGGLPVFEVFANNSIVAGQYGKNDFVISGNKIGIATASPTSQLEVGNVNTSGTGITVSARYDQSEAYIRFRTGHPNNSNVWETANISATDGGNYNGTLSFRTAVSSQSSPSTKMTILPTGNVGIGITSPAAKLDVSGVIRGDAGSDYPHSFTNTDSGNTHWTNRGGRLLTSNATGWQTDGRDPIIALVTSGNSNSLNIANSIGLALHNESQTNNTFSPAITFSNLSNSGNYNTTYAAIIGKKTGQGVDSNWSAGELHFYTMPVSAYVSNIPSLIIKSDGAVGIGTTSPGATLQVGTGTPTASTSGIQFGDDAGARIYRSSSSVISVANSFAASNGYVYASNYLQTGNNLIYPSSLSATQRLEVGNAANNAWIDGLTIAPGGNVVVAGTLTESSSIRYKENIETINAPILPKLEAIRPVTYNKKDNPNNIEYGIIAEELNDLFPEFVNKNENGEIESVNYSRLTVLLIKAVKELKEEVDRLKNK